MAARAGIDGRRDWTLERILSTFPRLAERLGHAGLSSQAASQQMLTIGQALIDQPRSADPR